MTTNSMDQGESPIDTGQRLDIKPISEAFAQGREDIVINHSQEVNIGPEAAEFARLFHHVGIQSFADLQALSFIPESLDQTRALEALASDDASAFSAAQNYVHAGNKPCGCREAQTTGEIYRKGGYALELRAAYQDIRGRHNRNLHDC